MVHDVWVEVNFTALKHNFAQLRAAISANTRIMAVVKGNGFGHGYVEPAKAFVEAGADALAVTRIDEAIPLRQAGISAPIVLFAPILPDNAQAAIEADLEMTVCSTELACALSATAERIGKTARIWVKVDTGMGRLGLLPKDTLGFFSAIRGLPNLQLAGIYTHFARAAEADPGPTQRQLHCFQQLLTSLREAGIDYGQVSAANSAAILRLPESHFDMIRPGTILYGQYPSQHVPHTLDLKPTWTLKARICEVRELARGSRIGYGGEHTTTRATKTAIVPIGYADGFTLTPEGPIYRQSTLKFAARKIKRSLFMEVRGKKAPVLGRVAMQMTVLDVTNINGVQVGDEVIVPAQRVPTSPLIPRIYVDSSRPGNILDDRMIDKASNQSK